MIGTALAIGLGLAGASAAGQIYGAKKAAGTAKEAGQIQSDAANRAAEMQLAGTREGLDFLREEAGYNRRQQAPYRAIGTGAVNTLANLTGVPMVYDQAPAAPAGPTGTTLGSVGQPPPMNQARPRPGVVDMARGPDGSYGVADEAGSVLLRAPNGQTRRVPVSQAAHYLAQGAQRVA